MKNKITGLLFLALSTSAFGLGSLGDLSSGKYDNGHPVQEALVTGRQTVYVSAGNVATTAVDAFTSKTNKYAETPAVRVYAYSGGVHVKWGSSAPTATTSDFFIASGASVVYVVDPAAAYLSVIGAGTNGTKVFVTEMK